jgi:hypothetical protein
MHNEMLKFKTNCFQKNIKLFFLSYIIFFSSALLANTAKKNIWYVDLSLNHGTMARVDVGEIDSKFITFAVIFEYERNCDPLFSMLVFRKKNFGSNISKILVTPGNYILIIDGYKYTWHSVYAQYEFGYELAIGVTKEAWNKLILSPRSITLSVMSQKSYIVPTVNFSNSLVDAANACIQKIGKR